MPAGGLLALVLSAACVLAASGCTPGPPATFYTPHGNGYLRVPGLAGR